MHAAMGHTVNCGDFVAYRTTFVINSYLRSGNFVLLHGLCCDLGTFFDRAIDGDA